MVNQTPTIKELLGVDKLVKGGEEFNVESLTSGKTAIGLYFSAHWCPPCKAFTPKLAEFYNKNAKEKNFEIVFVSSDKDEGAFKEYFAEMPWAALPYSDREAKDKLSSKFGVRGIPSFVIIDGEGNLITKDGRSGVMEDAEAAEFPWHPKPFSELLGTEFINNKGDKVALDNEKPIALYFSAHWCPPCKAFTPKFVKTYEAIKAGADNLQVVFCSSDRDQASFDEYFAEMPWYAIPFGDKRKAGLSKHFEVNGIPSLIVVNADGTVINSNARGSVEEDPEGKDAPWHPKPFTGLDSAAERLEDEVSLIALVKDDALEKVKTEIEPIAQGWKEKHADKPLLFLHAAESSELRPRLSGFLGLEEDTTMIITNFTAGKKYVGPKVEPTPEAVKSFAEDYLAGKLEAVSLK